MLARLLLSRKVISTILLSNNMTHLALVQPYVHKCVDFYNSKFALKISLTRWCNCSNIFLPWYTVKTKSLILCNAYLGIICKVTCPDL